MKASEYQRKGFIQISCPFDPRSMGGRPHITIDIEGAKPIDARSAEERANIIAQLNAIRKYIQTG